MNLSCKSHCLPNCLSFKSVKHIRRINYNRTIFGLYCFNGETTVRNHAILRLTAYCDQLCFHCLLIQVTSCIRKFRFCDEFQSYCDGSRIRLTLTVNKSAKTQLFSKKIVSASNRMTHRRCYSICH